MNEQAGAPETAAMTGPAAGRRCPCNSGEILGNCCGRYLAQPGDGGLPVPAPTAEALMRSRFTAFALGDAAYLLRTWHPGTRPDSLELDPGLEWHLLEILGAERGGPFDRDGTVTFRAHHRLAANRRERESFTETSTFVRENGQWLYVEALEID